jgi:23S rRNA (adenine2503-C2)-methyltransferase
MPAPGELTLIAPRRRKPPRHLADLDVGERRAVVTELGQPAFRAAQVARHYFVHRSTDPQNWSDVPEGARGPLAQALLPRLLEPLRSSVCDDGLTRKTVWRLFDGAAVESVVMRYPERVTVCVSSQAGCGMNCPFCATGQAGLTRNLSAAEIVDQVVAAAGALDAGLLAGGPARLSNVVFMGMGEPLANYDATVSAVARLIEATPDGMGLSRRGITVSTVGLVPGIEKLARSGLGVTLALSLHAPDDELRDTLVPINRRWPVAETVGAAHGYWSLTGRRVSIEYALIRDVNDQAERAEALARLLVSIGGTGWVHVNLIPLNPTPGSAWTASRRRDESTFVRVLERHGVAVTVRDTRGREIDGACGQLAAATSRTAPDASPDVAP